MEKDAGCATYSDEYIATARSDPYRFGLLGERRKKGNFMMRSIPLLVVVLLTCWGAAGCTSCQGTNDYCGPLPDEPCDFFYRRNSILGGDQQMRNTATEQAPSQQENLPTPAPESPDGEGQETPTPAPMPPDADVPPETDLPPNSDAPTDSNAPPESELPPGAAIESGTDPYAYQPAEPPHGLFGSLFRRR